MKRDADDFVSKCSKDNLWPAMGDRKSKMMKPQLLLLAVTIAACASHHDEAPPETAPTHIDLQMHDMKMDFEKSFPGLSKSCVQATRAYTVKTQKPLRLELRYDGEGRFESVTFKEQPPPPVKIQDCVRAGVSRIPFPANERGFVLPVELSFGAAAP